MARRRLAVALGIQGGHRGERLEGVAMSVVLGRAGAHDVQAHASLAGELHNP